MTQTYVHGDAVPVIGGAYRAKRAVVDYLEAELPIIYPNLGRIWDLQTEQQWIAPNKIYDFEAIRLNPSEFPVMVVAVLNTGAVTPMGPDDVTGDTLFYVDYNMRIYAWMRAATVWSASCVIIRLLPCVLRLRGGPRFALRLIGPSTAIWI